MWCQTDRMTLCLFACQFSGFELVVVPLSATNRNDDLRHKSINKQQSEGEGAGHPSGFIVTGKWRLNRVPFKVSPSMERGAESIANCAILHPSLTWTVSDAVAMVCSRGGEGDTLKKANGQAVASSTSH